jgi:hypothetical protein
MPDTSPILDLPFLLPAQAQKHVTHNAALERLDRLVQLRVGRFDAQVPPPAPAPGEMHALGPAPTGAWAGQAHALAAWDGTAWAFLAPQPGWRAWGIEEGALRVWTGSAWTLPPARNDDLAGLGIGTAADATNRLSVRAAATLLSHEGAGHQLKVNKAGAADTAALLFQSAWTGHAEIGLAGDTDFSIKVSPDGAAWTEALRLDAATGRASGAAVQADPEDTTAGRLMRADYGYSPGNLLGPVGQAGGVPTGAAIERGENANGTYLRLADGTQICWHEMILPYSTAAKCEGSWTYPAAFAAAGNPVTTGSTSGDSPTPSSHTSGSTPLAAEVCPGVAFGAGGPASVLCAVFRQAKATDFQPGDAIRITLAAFGRWY